MRRTKQDIQALIKKGETFHLECKKAQGGLPSSLWESYSAFCNTDGGVILLGVKEEDDSFSVEGVADATAIVKTFWDTVHNREKVSACVLTEKDVRVEDCDGKSVVVINVPRAERRARPVYIGNNVYEGTYRRNGEGDYKCTAESVESMIRDRCEETADACLMDELTAEDLNYETIRRYRRRFANFKPTSQWNGLQDHDFLKVIGALRKDENGVLRPTLAGLVCFGDFITIAAHVPNYFVDYREKLTGETRWNDRVCAHDGTWSGNIYDFFFQIHDKIVADVRKPFAIAKDGISRIDETDIHESIREVLANALIHADYHGRRGIVVEKCFRRLIFENPGCFRVSRDDAVVGGRSDARNQYIFNIFALVKIGERSGHGLSNLFSVWKKSGFPDPSIGESYDPDRTTVELNLDEAVSGRVKSRVESRVKGSVESSVKGSAESSVEPDGNQISAPKQTKNRPKTEDELAKSGPDVGQKINTSSVKGSNPLEELSASAKQVYRALCLDQSLTYVALISRTGLSNRTIEVAIATLIKRGLLRRVGPKKGGHWEIVKPQPPTGGLGS